MSKPLRRSIEDAQQVVAYLEDNGGEATVSELSEAVDVPANELHWIIESMDYLGLVDSDVQLSLESPES